MRISPGDLLVESELPALHRILGNNSTYLLRSETMRRLSDMKSGRQLGYPISHRIDSTRPDLL